MRPSLAILDHVTLRYLEISGASWAIRRPDGPDRGGKFGHCEGCGHVEAKLGGRAMLMLSVGFCSAVLLALHPHPKMLSPSRTKNFCWFLRAMLAPSGEQVNKCSLAILGPVFHFGPRCFCVVKQRFVGAEGETKSNQKSFQNTKAPPKR